MTHDRPFVNVRDYGASGDGRTLDTRAIQSAIDACRQAGGGTVYVPAGDYVTGSLFLASHLTLHLDAGARLLGSQDVADYPVVDGRWEGVDRKTHAPLIARRRPDQRDPHRPGHDRRARRGLVAAASRRDAGPSPAAPDRPDGVRQRPDRGDHADPLAQLDDPPGQVSQRDRGQGDDPQPARLAQHGRHQPRRLPQRAHFQLPHRRGRRLYHAQVGHRGGRPRERSRPARTSPSPTARWCTATAGW